MIGGGGGGGAPPPPPQSGSSNPGGQFLLQLLQNPHQPQTSTTPTQPQPQPQPQPSHQQQQDPAVASMGPTLPFSSSNGQDPHSPSPLPPWLITPHHPGFAPPPWVLAGLPPQPSNFPPANFPFVPAEDLQKLGLLGSGQQQQYLQQRNMETLMFGSLPNKNSIDRSQFGVHKVPEVVVGANRSLNGAEIGFNSGRNLELDHQLNSNFGAGAGGGMGKRQQQPVQHAPVGGGGGGGGGGGWGRNQQPVHHAPPGFQQKQKGHDQQGLRRKLGHNVDREAGGRDEFNSIIQHDGSSRLGLGTQLDRPGPPGGSKLHSVPASEIEESLATLHGQAAEEDRKQRLERRENRSRDEANGSMYPMDGGREQEELSELMHAVKVRDEFERRNVVEKYNTSRDKDLRSDLQSDVFREVTVPSQRMRNPRRVVICRSNIDTMNGAFLRIFESLVPVEEEKAKQKQLLQLLEKLVNKEWPRAELYLYGSCANSFGVSKSDIDVCLAIEDENTTKPEILLKLADLLQSDNLQNVQALTRARVPIVKLMDPITGISCDICINNVLAVVNTKLLRDYAQIDVRLRQLAFIVKHWAKSRGVNVTYQGTLSSYAYVLMCIHFLQQRKPAILPCLQRMEATYVVTVDEIECAYFDQVEKLHDFGAQNKESIAQLVWAFFDYWAFRHDYANAVISVRTGSIISKREKDWTRRIGNDRHLICIEDPFEVSHDLGRVVDKYSIKILREEFERAADILQYAPDPCVTLFEPYVPEPSTTS